jgi:hypothetical protein
MLRTAPVLPGADHDRRERPTQENPGEPGRGLTSGHEVRATLRAPKPKTRTGSFASCWFTIGLVAAGVAAACADKGDGDDLFYCDRGSEGCPCASKDLCLPGLVCDRAADLCVEAVGSGGSNGSGTGGSGPITGGSTVVAGVPSVAGSGGSLQGTGGVVAPGGGKPSGGDASSGGAGFAGGAGVVGSHGGASGGAGIAGSEQGGSASTEGGSAGNASAGAPDVGSRTIQIGGLLDAFVDSCDTPRNTGSEQTLSVDSDPCMFEIYIQPASLSDIPSGATLESALLELQCLDLGDPVQVLRITDEWSEGSVNWENRPSVGDEIGSFAAEEGPIVVDITSLVEDWLGGAPMHGVALVQTATDGSDYPSSESGQDGAPRILVTYKP